jgi:uncharacterized membrane protein
MKFSSEIEIDAPIEKVVKLFIDPEQMKKWVRELESFETVYGKSRHLGSKAILKLIVDEKGVEVIETVTVRNLPYQFTGKYEAEEMDYSADNRFEDLGNDRTRYVVDLEFKFRGMLNLMGDAMKRSFKKRSEQQLNDFKIFAEKDNRSNR